MFHQPYGFAIRDQNRLMVYRLMYKKNHRSVWQHRSRTKPATHHPAGQPCSSTALRSYPSAYPSRLGSLILANQFNRSGMIFSLVFRLSRRFIFPAKSQVPTGTAFTACPRIPLPGHTRKIEFPKVMSTYKFSLCRLELVVCRDFIFFFFDSIQEVLSLALYSAAACLSFY